MNKIDMVSAVRSLHSNLPRNCSWWSSLNFSQKNFSYSFSKYSAQGKKYYI